MLELSNLTPCSLAAALTSWELYTNSCHNCGCEDGDNSLRLGDRREKNCTEGCACLFPLLIFDLSLGEDVQFSCKKAEDPDGSKAVSKTAVAAGIPKADPLILIQRQF